MRPERIGIRTSASEVFDEQHSFLMLICVEECNGESDEPNIDHFPHHVLPPGGKILVI
jgi:hypothetical protein